MRKNMGEQSDGYVGIFWYDPKIGELFGVDKESAKSKDFDDKGMKTGKVLHMNYWVKQYHRAMALGKHTRFSGDYTKVPRGRVWERKGKGFAVTVGEWIKDFPDARELVLIEFDLPDNTEFIIDEHWSIGSGWEGDKI